MKKKELKFKALKTALVVKAERKKLNNYFLNFLLRTTGSEDRIKLYGSDPLK